MSWICIHCGYENKEDNQFCLRCGSFIADSMNFILGHIGGNNEDFEKDNGDYW